MFTIEGKLVEVGDLFLPNEGDGLVIETPTGKVIVIGLTHDQCRKCAKLFGDTVNLQLAAAHVIAQEA